MKISWKISWSFTATKFIYPTKNVVSVSTQQTKHNNVCSPFRPKNYSYFFPAATSQKRLLEAYEIVPVKRHGEKAQQNIDFTSRRINHPFRILSHFKSRWTFPLLVFPNEKLLPRKWKILVSLNTEFFITTKKFLPRTKFYRNGRAETIFGGINKLAIAE